MKKKNLLKTILSITLLGFLTIGVSLQALQMSDETLDTSKMEPGTLIQTDSDGTKTIMKPDGTSIQLKPDGSKVIKKSDGTIIQVPAEK